MLSRLKAKNIQRWASFVVGGVINTGFSYILYLGLSFFLPYQLAYALAYVIGIFFSYWFNSTVVFGVSLSWRRASLYPLVYVVQYLISALFLGVLVELLSVGRNVAPILVSVAMFPVSYLFSKILLVKI